MGSGGRAKRQGNPSSPATAQSDAPVDATAPAESATGATAAKRWSPPSRRGWKWLRARLPGGGESLSTWATVGPIAAVAMTYAYAIVAWHGLGLRAGDFDLSLTAIAPSAGLLGLTALAGVTLVALTPERFSTWVVYGLLVLLAGLDTLVPTLATLAGGVVIQGLTFMALAVGFTAGAFAADRGEYVVPRPRGASDERYERIVRWSLIAPAVAMVVAGYLSLVQQRQLIERGKVPAVSLLPMGAGSTIRYVTVMPLDDHLRLNDVACALTFGKAGDGSLRLRVVRADGRVQLLVVEPGAVLLTAADPCAAELRKGVWGPLNATASSTPQPGVTVAPPTSTTVAATTTTT